MISACEPPLYRRILEMKSHGLTAVEIGVKLEMSPGRVEGQLRRAEYRLGARNTAHAVYRAMRAGWFG